MPLRTMGFFRELPHGDPDGPSLRDAVERAPDDASSLADHLASGEPLAVSSGMVADVLDDLSHRLLAARRGDG